MSNQTTTTANADTTIYEAVTNAIYLDGEKWPDIAAVANAYPFAGFILKTVDGWTVIEEVKTIAKYRAPAPC